MGKAITNKKYRRGRHRPLLHGMVVSRHIGYNGKVIQSEP